MITRPKTSVAMSASLLHRCLRARPTTDSMNGIVDRSMRFQSACREIDSDSWRPRFEASPLNEAFPVMTDLINDKTKPEAENPLVLRTMNPDFRASGSS